MKNTVTNNTLATHNIAHKKKRENQIKEIRKEKKRKKATHARYHTGTKKTKIKIKINLKQNFH